MSKAIARVEPGFLLPIATTLFKGYFSKSNRIVHPFCKACTRYNEGMKPYEKKMLQRRVKDHPMFNIFPF